MPNAENCETFDINSHVNHNLRCVKSSLCTQFNSDGNTRTWKMKEEKKNLNSEENVGIEFELEQAIKRFIDIN